MRRLLLALLAVTAAAQSPPEPTVAPPASTEPAAPIRDDDAALKRVQERKGAIERELARLRGQEKSLLGEVERLELEVRLRTEELREAQAVLQKANAQLDATSREVRVLEKNIAEARPVLAARARALYKMGDLSYLRILLSVDRPSDIFRGYRLVTTVARRDNQRIARFRADLQSLDGTQKRLEQETQDALALKDRLDVARRTLDQDRRRKTAALTSLVEKKENQAAFLEELQEAEGKLRDLIAGFGSGEVAVPLPVFRGSLPWPAAGRVRVGYGRRKHPRFDTYTIQNGLEIEAPVDSPVRAVHEGTVAFSDFFRGYGLMVVVDHGGKHHSLYAHLAENRVQAGDRVTAGQTIGTVGASGLDGPGVYFEMRFQGKPVDPGGLAEAGRVPLDASSNRPYTALDTRVALRGAGCIIEGMSPRGRLFIAILSTAFVGYVAVGSLLNRVLGDTSYTQLAIFNDVTRIVLEAYVEPVNLDRAMGGARLGLTEALDGDTAYLDAEEWKAYQQPGKDGDAEVGLTLSRRLGFLMVVSARTGSPAEKAGLRPGDVLKAIDGRHTRPLPGPVGQRLLRGAPGSVVKITVLRAGEPDPLEISLVRERPTPVPAKGRILEGNAGTGYLKVAELRDKAADDVRSELEALRRAGARELVLDLRGVAEGNPAEAVKVAELFMKGGTVAKLKGVHVPEQVLSANASHSMWDLPMTTLIDHGTAGAGEIVASALLDANRSSLVGKRTFGRAPSLKSIPLEEGGIVMTVAKYYNSKDEPIHGKGVEPTVAVKTGTNDEDADDEDAASPKDLILEKAIEVLHGAPEVKKAA